jgi:transketolase
MSASTESRKLAKASRKSIIEMVYSGKSSHVASSLSVVDALAVIYSGSFNINPDNFSDVSRDRIIMSKGHAAAAYYSVLAHAGFLDRKILNTYSQDGSLIGGHVTNGKVSGVEFSSGSLGHGMPYGVGLAMGMKKNSINAKVCVVMSDGECDEGTTWESALLANHWKLNNLTILIDRNGLQSLTTTEETLALEPFAEKWKAFGWEVISINGNDHDALINSFKIKSNGPKCIIANTTKGFGVEFMQNSVLWHYRTPSSEEVIKALTEIEKM